MFKLYTLERRRHCPSGELHRDVEIEGRKVTPAELNHKVLYEVSYILCRDSSWLSGAYGVLKGQQIVDLHAAYASYLREVRSIYRWREMAQVILPPDMLKSIEGGEMAMEAAHLALDYLETIRSSAKGQEGETHVYELSEVKLMAPLPRPVSIRDCSAFPRHSKNMQGANQPALELPEVCPVCGAPKDQFVEFK